MGLFIVREGHGEEDALPALVARVQAHLDLELPHIPKYGNWRKSLLAEPQVRAVCGQIRTLTTCEALLLTRDADNDQLADRDCPKTTAPQIAAWTRELGLPFPTAVVLFYKEYETLFLAGAEAMAGQELTDRRNRKLATISHSATAHPDPEYVRDAKGWVQEHLVHGYKPTLYQASLTRMLNLEVMEASGLSSYRRLVSALRFLSTQRGKVGLVYPPSPDPTDG